MKQSMTNPQWLESAHRQATEKTISEVAKFLQELLSRTLTAYIVGVREGKTVTRWANQEVTVIREHETEQRLRAAYEIAQMLLTEVDPSTAKAWFLGMNPELDGEAPATLLRQDRFKEVFLAARAFVTGA